MKNESLSYGVYHGAGVEYRRPNHDDPGSILAGTIHHVFQVKVILYHTKDAKYTEKYNSIIQLKKFMYFSGIKKNISKMS